jgi:hypothetical protein
VPLVGTLEGSSVALEDPLDRMAVVGGGEQGAHLQKDRLVDKIYSRESADYFDWLVVGYATLDFPTYAWYDLRPSRLASGSAFAEGAADFRNYVAALADLEPGGGFETVRRKAREIRRAAWLNLADFTLWSGATRMVRYVRTGQRRTKSPVLRIKGLRLVPGAYSTLSSVGPENGVDVRVLSARYLGHLNVRRTSARQRAGRWGAGFGLTSREARWRLPEMQGDLWQRAGPTPGFRMEAGSRGVLRPGEHALEGAFRLGYKSAGYLVDAPARAGLLASVSASIRF